MSNHAGQAVVAPQGLELRFSRTTCLGTCPAYTVTVHRDGTVDWEGEDEVRVKGKAHGRLERGKLDQIAVGLETIHFFQRESDGRMPPPPCDTKGGTVICLRSITVCSDTSHFELRVTRDGKTHEIDDAHCYEEPELRQFEKLLDEIVGTSVWIGR